MDGPGIADSAQIPVVGAGIDGGQILLFCGDGSVDAAFDLAAQTFADVGGSTLSLGMSGDWERAIAHGSTMIRIGSALFGPRPAREGALV